MKEHDSDGPLPFDEKSHESKDTLQFMMNLTKLATG